MTEQEQELINKAIEAVDRMGGSALEPYKKKADALCAIVAASAQCRQATALQEISKEIQNVNFVQGQNYALAQKIEGLTQVMRQIAQK